MDLRYGEDTGTRDNRITIIGRISVSLEGNWHPVIQAPHVTGCHADRIITDEKFTDI